MTPLPWLEKNPENAPLREVGEAGRRTIEGAETMVQPVSEKQSTAKETKKKIALPTDPVAEEEDEDEWLMEMLGKVPFCGDQLQHQLFPE